MIRYRRFGTPLRYRIDVAARIAAALFGAYALAAAVAMAMARALPMSRSEAVTTATIIGVLALPAAVIRIFAARSAVRAWIEIGAVTLIAALIAWRLGPPA